MPELPEVETMRRGILSLVGSTIRNIAKVPNACKPIRIEPTLPTFRRRISGRQIQTIERWGKRVVLRLDNTDRIIFEPRMTGLVLLTDPPDQEHLRIRIQFHGPVGELLYWDRRGLGGVSLMSDQSFHQEIVERKLGPDALLIDVEMLSSRLSKTACPIKVALLDQKKVAGIGNLYASEILHEARVSPLRRTHRIRPGEWVRIHSAMRRILEIAIQHEGSTLSDGTYRNALNNPGSYQNHHQVYDREGELCPACRSGKIRRIVIGQRATFYCRLCQR